jgi:hypothetical protein
LRYAVLALVAAALLAVGGMLGVASAQWTVESRWSLHVKASEDLHWFLRFPQPEPPTQVEVFGTVDLGVPENTEHGLLGSATGAGNATITYVWRETLFAMRADPWRLGTYMPPSGGLDDQGFWVWRESANPAAPLEVLGGGVREATRFQGRYERPLFGYRGDLQEGWTALQPLAGGAHAVIGYPSASDLSIAFLVAGTVVAGLVKAGRRVETARSAK